MGLVLIIGAAWLALAGAAVVLMSVVGRVASHADRVSSGHVAELLGQSPVRLAVSNDEVITDADTAVCPSCASLVVGAVEGDDCPACGTRVAELPRIHPHVAPIRRSARQHRAV